MDSPSENGSKTDVEESKRLLLVCLLLFIAFLDFKGFLL